MNSNIMTKLAYRLDQRTQEGMLEWFPSEGNCYRLALGDGVMEIVFNPKPIKKPFGTTVSDVYELHALNERNEQIGYLGVSAETDPNYALLKSIYQCAESGYLKIDSTFRSMMEALNS